MTGNHPYSANDPSLTASVSGIEGRANLPIGVFDSGLGGLRVLDRLMQAFPQERFVYLGDTLHMPYGHKTHEQVNHYVEKCLDWFFTNHPVKVMVIACNTASAAASSQFLSFAPVPFVDPVTAMCGWLAETGSYRDLGLLATPATVASNRYRAVLDSLGAKDINIHAVACEHLATVIEEGGVGTPECNALLDKYVTPLRQRSVEAIVLGCTHYPYAQAQIAALAPDATILDPDVCMVMAVEQLLQRSFLEATRSAPLIQQQDVRPENQESRVRYFVTDAPERFYETSRGMPFQALAMVFPEVIAPAFRAEEGVKATGSISLGI